MNAAAPAAPPAWQERWLALVARMVLVTSPAEEEQLIASLCRLERQRTEVLAFVNAHALNSAAASADFFQAVRAADVVLRDGSGVALLLRLLELEPGLNLNGTDLIPKLLACFAGRRIALYGTQEPYLSRARAKLLAQGGTTAGCDTAHGFLDAAQYIALAHAQRPELIVLGMGMPRQEQVALALREALAHPCLIVCGGAIIDFLGDKTSRAPRWMRRTGLEWAFRLALEPRRLFRRYVIGNPLFVSRALRLVAAPAGQRPGAAG